MTEIEVEAGGPQPRSGTHPQRLIAAVKGAGPLLLFGIRLWASVSLALYIAFWLQLDSAYWAGTSAAIVCQPSLGASLRKGWYRMVGTVIGAIAIVVLTARFPQERALFLTALALWGAACAFASTLLRNYASYSAALAGYTAAIIASDQLGSVGGLNGDAFNLAITRASEICIGIVCAGIVLGLTDFGGARQRLAASFAQLLAEITHNFLINLRQPSVGFATMQILRRDLLRRVIALDPAIDEAFGESSELRYHSPILPNAVDGLFSALAAWRTVALHFAQLGQGRANQRAEDVRHHLPEQLLSAPQDPAFFMAEPERLRQSCVSAVRGLLLSAGDDPSRRLLTVRTADVFAGVARALNGLALLVGHEARPVQRNLSLRVPDFLPSLVSGGRALVTIALVEMFWIITAWPGGAAAITWASITVILFAPRAEQAYANALLFTVGSCLAAVCASVVLFAVLPRVETFAGLSLVIGLYLVPFGALMAQPWQRPLFVAMAANFIPLLAPTNQMNYDISQYFNGAMALIGGSAVGALAFRLIPPLSPAYRTRRLLGLTLRALRRLATSKSPMSTERWQGLCYSRLAVMPEEAAPVQRAELLTVLSIGTNIIRLRRIADRIHLAPLIAPALEALARGDSRETVRQLEELERALPAQHGPAFSILRLRGLALALSEAINQHATFLASGELG